LGLEAVPVRFLDISEDEAHKLALADGPHAMTKPTRDKLGALLAAWDEDDDEDLTDLGFDRDELDKLIGSRSVEAEVFEVDVSSTDAEFYLSVHGPLSVQADVLERLRADLESMPDVEVEITTTEF
jgi:hypothetical protein